MSIRKAAVLACASLLACVAAHAADIPAVGPTYGCIDAQSGRYVLCPSDPGSDSVTRQMVNAVLKTMPLNVAHGLAGIDGSGRITAPTIGLVSLTGATPTATPGATDTTLATLAPAAPTALAIGQGGTAGRAAILEILIVQPATGGYPVTITGPIAWPSGAVPVISAAAGDRTFIRLLTTDGGKSYIGGI